MRTEDRTITSGQCEKFLRQISACECCHEVRLKMEDAELAGRATDAVEADMYAIRTLEDLHCVI